MDKSVEDIQSAYLLAEIALEEAQDVRRALRTELLELSFKASPGLAEEYGICEEPVYSQVKCESPANLLGACIGVWSEDLIDRVCPFCKETVQDD